MSIVVDLASYHQRNCICTVSLTMHSTPPHYAFVALFCPPRRSRDRTIVYSSLSPERYLSGSSDTASVLSPMLKRSTLRRCVQVSSLRLDAPADGYRSTEVQLRIAHLGGRAPTPTSETGVIWNGIRIHGVRVSTSSSVRVKIAGLNIV